MNFIKLGISYILTFIVFLAIDLLWLGLIAREFYRKHLGHYLSDQVNWTAALIFYSLYIAGVFIFSILPAMEKNSIARAVVMGGLFGFFTYVTYDLTNLATLKNWPLTIVFIDIVWGAVLTAVVSAAGFLIVRWIK